MTVLQHCQLQSRNSDDVLQFFANFGLKYQTVVKLKLQKQYKPFCVQVNNLNNLPKFHMHKYVKIKYKMVFYHLDGFIVSKWYYCCKDIGSLSIFLRVTTTNNTGQK